MANSILSRLVALLVIFLFVVSWSARSPARGCRGAGWLFFGAVLTPQVGDGEMPGTSQVAMAEAEGC